MTLFNSSWLWVLIAGVVYIALFILVYFSEGFSGMAVVLIVAAAVLFLVVGIMYMLKDQSKNIEKFLDMQVEETFSRLDTQQMLLNASVDAAERQLRTTGNVLEKVVPVGYGRASSSFGKNVKGATIPFKSS